MYVGLKQPRGDGERYVTPARAAAKETTMMYVRRQNSVLAGRWRPGARALSRLVSSVGHVQRF